MFSGLPTLSIATMTEQDVIPLAQSSIDVPITFVTAPRPFDDETSARQRAAILSWQLQPGNKEILLLGDEAGIAEFAAEFGFSHVAKIKKSEPDGIPLMNSLFQEASKAAKHGVICYINTDISLPPASWWAAIQHTLPLLMAQEKDFLIAGPRLEFPEEIEAFNSISSDWGKWRAQNVLKKTYSDPIIDGAIDWFVYRRGAYDEFPPFKLGRFVWDSWMVDSAVRAGWNTVSTYNQSNVGEQTTYGMHWHHSRAHQISKRRGDERLGNGIIASKHGGLGGFGRLRGMELGLDRCDNSVSYCLKRRFDYDVLARRLPRKS